MVARHGIWWLRCVVEDGVICGMRYADVQILQRNRQPLSLLCLDDLLPYCIARYCAPIEVVLSHRSLLCARCARTNCIVAPARAMRTQKVRWKAEARIQTTRVRSLDLDQSPLLWSKYLTPTRASAFLLKGTEQREHVNVDVCMPVCRKAGSPASLNKLDNFCEEGSLVGRLRAMFVGKTNVTCVDVYKEPNVVCKCRRPVTYDADIRLGSTHIKRSLFQGDDLSASAYPTRYYRRLKRHQRADTPRDPIRPSEQERIASNTARTFCDHERQHDRSNCAGEM